MTQQLYEFITRIELFIENRRYGIRIYAKFTIKPAGK